jgi:hypothetical protein
MSPPYPRSARVRTGLSLDRRATQLADAAGVSRSWLYRQPQLREQIEQVRQQQPSKGPAVPAAERATADSLRQQIHAYREEIARLTKENQALYEQLARQLGAARAAAVIAPF